MLGHSCSDEGFHVLGLRDIAGHDVADGVWVVVQDALASILCGVETEVAAENVNAVEAQDAGGSCAVAPGCRVGDPDLAYACYEGDFACEVRVCWEGGWGLVDEGFGVHGSLLVFGWDEGMIDVAELRLK